MFEPHQTINSAGCIFKMSPLAGQNRNFEKLNFCNFFILKVVCYMRKRRTFARCFLCCIFHQHFLVRPTGFEPAAFRVGVIRPSSWKALRRKGLVGVAQISAILKKISERLASYFPQAQVSQGFWWCLVAVSEGNRGNHISQDR